MRKNVILKHMLILGHDMVSETKCENHVNKLQDVYFIRQFTLQHRIVLKSKSWGWRDGPWVRTVFCSCRGPGFCPQFPYGMVHNCL